MRWAGGRCFHVTECFGLRLANGGFDSKHPLSVISLWPEVCIKCSWFNSVKACSTLTTWALLTVAANPSCVSGFGRLLASCFEIVGPVSLMVDLEPMEKRGKELPAGYALLRRLKAKLGTRLVDLILGDDLYLNAPFFNLCLGEMKSDVLVKTDERGLRIIQDAEGLFRAKDDPACDIVTVCGVDTMRRRSYQITQAGGVFSRWHRHTTDGCQSRRGRYYVPAKC